MFCTYDPFESLLAVLETLGRFVPLRAACPFEKPASYIGVKKNKSWTIQTQRVNQLFGFQFSYLFLCWANMAERSGISMVKNNMSRSGPM